MHYIEIGQDIVDAIKGGANYNGENEAEEIVGNINQFGDLVKMIATYLKEFFEAIKSYFNK